MLRGAKSRYDTSGRLFTICDLCLVMTIRSKTLSCEAIDIVTNRTQDFDLSKGETRESTTVYGHAFLDLIRRTADKRYGIRSIRVQTMTDPIF